MQYLRKLQSHLSESLWIRSHREPNKQRDFIRNSISSSNGLPTALSTFPVATTHKGTNATQPQPQSSSVVVVVSNLRDFDEEEAVSRKSNHLLTAPKSGRITQVESRNKSTTLSVTTPITEIKSLACTAANNNHHLKRVHSSVNPDPVQVISSFHHQQDQSSLSNDSNILLALQQNKSIESSLQSTSSQENAEPVILSLTPLTRSAKNEYLRSNRRSSTGGCSFKSAKVTVPPVRVSTSAQIFKRQEHNNNCYYSPGPSPCRHKKDKGSDEFLKDIINVRNRKRFENLERVSEPSYSTASSASADCTKDFLQGSSRSTDPEVESNDSSEEFLLPEESREWRHVREKVPRDRSSIAQNVKHTKSNEEGNCFEVSTVTSELSTLLLPLNTPLGKERQEICSQTIATQLEQIPRVDDRIDSGRKVVDKNFTRRRSSITNSNIYSSDPFWDRQENVHNKRRTRQIQSCIGKLRCENSVSGPSESVVNINSISKSVQEKEYEENALRDNHYRKAKERFTFPGAPSFPREDCAGAEEIEAGFSQRRDQTYPPRFPSPLATFSRERAFFTSSSNNSSTESLIDSGDSWKVAGASSAPVVRTVSSNTVLPIIGVSFSASSGLVDGLTCSQKVNQRKKSIINNQSAKSNSESHNSELSTVRVRRYQQRRRRKRSRKKHSIFQSLLCTNGFNLVDSPKKLLCVLFHPKRHTQTVTENKSTKSTRKPSLSVSPSYFQSQESFSHSGQTKKNNPKFNSRRRGPSNTEQRLWVTMDHEDLIRELPQIEKLSNQERLRLAHKRRMLQLKKFQQYEKELNSNSKKHRAESDLLRRNLPGKHNNVQHGQTRKGSRRIRFRNSIMLLEAAGRDDVEEVRLLLESGVNPDVANEDGLTALHQCCIDDNEEMMKILLDYGANVNSEDSEKWTPLHAAATCGHLHLVQYLIARGANLLGVNAEGNMPYDICDDETTLDYIESEMAKRGVTQELIEEIRALPETRMLQEMQRIHVQGGDLEFRDGDGATPLHIASANGYYRVAEYLLDNHAATDVQDKDFWQPIHAAACWGHLDVLELLVQNGADLDARTKNNETPYAICEDPEIKERIITLRTEQQTKRQNEGRKRPTRTHSTNSRTQSIRRTSQRDKGLTSKRDAADEAQMLRAREELHKENSPSPTSDATTNGKPGNNNATVAVNGNGVAHSVTEGPQNNVHQNGNTSSEEDPEVSFPSAMLGRDSVSNLKMKQDEMNRLREIAVKSGAINHANHQLNNQNSHHNNTSSIGNAGGIKMNNLLYNTNEAATGSLRKNQNHNHKNLNNTNNVGNGSSPVSVLTSPDDNGNLLPKPEINPSVDNKVPLGGGGLSSGVSLSGSRENLVGLSSSAGNSTIDIHVSVTINTNSPMSTLTNGASLKDSGSGSTSPPGYGHNNSALSNLALSPGSQIFTPPGTLSDLKKQRSLIRTSSNPLTNGILLTNNNLITPPTSSSAIPTSPSSAFSSVIQTFSSTAATVCAASSGLMTFTTAPTSGVPSSLLLLHNQKSDCGGGGSKANVSSASSYYYCDWRKNDFNTNYFSQSQFDSAAFSASSSSNLVAAASSGAAASTTLLPSSSLSPSHKERCNGSNNNNSSIAGKGCVIVPTSALPPCSNYASALSYPCENCINRNNNTHNNPFNSNQHCCCSYLNRFTGGINDPMTNKYHPPASPTMSLRRFVGDPAETVGDYGDGGKRCCVIV